MAKRLLAFFGTLSIVAFVVLTAFAVDRGGDDYYAKKATKSNPSRTERLLQKIHQDIADDAAKGQTLQSTQTLKSKQPTIETSHIIFEDDFEGGQPNWQASASWGNTAQGGVGGFANEGLSDWEQDTNNFMSATTSWHETGVTLLQTDMLISPVITLPTQITIGGVTSDLNGATIDFALDWDSADPANDQFRVYAGLAQSLWALDTADPAMGTSSWLLEVSGDSPTQEFIRQFLTTPDIDLTTATAPVTLSYYYKSISEEDFDYNNVDVSTDNFMSYASVASYEGGVGTGGVETWTQATVNLDAYVGSTIKVRFSTNGDFGFVEPGALFALDEIDVSDAGGSLFLDDGGDTTPLMVDSGFIPGNQLTIDFGEANASANWVSFNLNDADIVTNSDVFAGSDGTIGAGDDIQIGLVFISGLGVAPGRGVYVDDFVLSGIGKFNNDVTAVSVDVPFPATVGEALVFGLNVLNSGLDPQTSFSWAGTIFDADGNQVAAVSGTFSGTLESDSMVTVLSSETFPPPWTPSEPGEYSIDAEVILIGDGNTEDNTTSLASDDSDGFGDQRYSPFVVTEETVLFSSQLYDIGDDPTAGPLLDEGFMVVSNSAPGVNTWHTTSNAFIPAVNGVPNYGGAYVDFDSLGRDQDEGLIIPNLDFSHVTSNATLAFKMLGVQGFSFSRMTAEVSNDGGHSYHEVLERVSGIDPQTGADFGGAAFRTAGLRPAIVDITQHAAGYSNVWIRFRYVGFDDGDFLIWGVTVSGQGLLAAGLQGVTDIANDQGKQVRLTWSASANDGQIDGVPITHYGVWRGVVDGGLSAIGGGGDVVAVESRQAMISNIKGLKAGTRFVIAQSGEQWDFVAGVLAHSDSLYNYVAPTLEDSVDYPFMVSAHTANPLVFANSNIVSGTSIDNLAPGVPTNFAATVIVVETAPAVDLTWEESEAADFQFFTLYRDDELVLRTTDLTYVDTEVSLGQSVTYRLTASDFGFNESQGAEVSFVVTGVGDAEEIPTEYSLANNYPNPFNPSTQIRYGLPHDSNVRLTLYNHLGQRVVTLVDKQQSAGFYTVQWDGRNASGNQVSSGIYFYRIESAATNGEGDFASLKKMILLK